MVLTLTRDAPPTTWLLVSTSPSGATTTPDPVPPLAAVVGALEDVEADHGRTDAVDHVDDGARIGIKQCLIFRRNLG